MHELCEPADCYDDESKPMLRRLRDALVGEVSKLNKALGE